MCYHFNAEGEFCIPWAQMSRELAIAKNDVLQLQQSYRNIMDENSILVNQVQALREALGLAESALCQQGLQGTYPEIIARARAALNPKD